MVRSFKHYECNNCGMITTNRIQHLQNEHENIYYDKWRSIAGNNDLENVFLLEQFKETIKPVTMIRNYNPKI